MSKKLIEGEDNKPSILSKITGYFKKQKGAAKADDDADATKADDDVDAAKADDDTDAKKTDDDADMSADKKEDDADDDDDQDDPDKDDDDESDEDEIEVNGEVVNLKDPAAARAAIEGLLATNAEQNELLTEAAAELSKTKNEVKNEIKSGFIPKNSKREKSIGTKEDKEIPEAFMPTEGSKAASILKVSLGRAKSGKKK